jgi:hypothetical protein
MRIETTNLKTVDKIRREKSRSLKPKRKWQKINQIEQFFAVLCFKQSNSKVKQTDLTAAVESQTEGWIG